MKLTASFLRRLFPQSLGGQLLVMLLLALAITQGLGLLLLTDERNRAVRAALGLEAAGRAANVALLLDDAPADLRPSILRAADSPLVRFEVGSEPEAPHDSADADYVLGQIRQILGQPDREVRADVHALAVDPVPIPDGMPAAMRPMHEAMMAGQTDPIEMTLSIRLAGGDWLNVRTMFHRPGLQLSPQALLPLLLMAVAVALVAWWTARRVVGPMRVLAVGADRLGRGLDADPLPMTGPSEVRETTQAFNRMKDRLTRFVNERTHMLAALSHDLRSPLTAMRLRIEMLDETDDSIRLKALVEEMQAMVEATLEFARGVAKAEPSADGRPRRAAGRSGGRCRRGQGHPCAVTAAACHRPPAIPETRAAQPDRQCGPLRRRGEGEVGARTGAGRHHHFRHRAGIARRSAGGCL